MNTLSISQALIQEVDAAFTEGTHVPGGCAQCEALNQEMKNAWKAGWYILLTSSCFTSSQMLEFLIHSHSQFGTQCL